MKNSRNIRATFAQEITAKTVLAEVLLNNKIDKTFLESGEGSAVPSPIKSLVGFPFGVDLELATKRREEQCKAG